MIECMVRKTYRIAGALGAAAMIVLALAGCAPSGFDANDGSQSGSTGYISPSGAPYTVGGDARVEEARRQMTPRDPANPTQLEKDRLALARSIKRISIHRLGKEGRVQLGGDTVAAKIEIITDKGSRQELIFYGKLDSVGNGRTVSKELSSTSQSEYTLELDVTDGADKKTTAGKAILKKYESMPGGKRRLLTDASIFWRTYLAQVDVFRDEDQKIEKQDENLVEILDHQAFAWVHNVVVTFGRSFYGVEVVTPATHAKEPPLRATLATPALILFTIAGEAVRTGEVPTSGTQAISGTVKVHSAELIGDAETSDERTFALVAHGLSGQPIDIALHVEGAPHVPGTFDPRLKGMTSKAYFSLSADEIARPRIKKVLQDLETNFELASVQKWIKAYTQTYRRESLVTALENALPFRPIISAAFAYRDVPAPTALLTLIESSFFAGGQYRIETNPKSTATGPFQILVGTGVDLGMNVYDHKKGELPPVQDERRYFIPSVCGASKHLSTSIDYFQRGDATVALLAYYIGDGAAASTVHCMLNRADCKRTSMGLTKVAAKKKNPFSTISKYRFSYRDISKQKMVGPGYLEYVDRALALYFVTGNPAAYKLVLNTENENRLPPRSVLLPSGARMKDADCLSAIQKSLNARQAARGRKT